MVTFRRGVALSAAMLFAAVGASAARQSGAAGTAKEPAGPPPLRLLLSSVTPEATIPVGGDRSIAATSDGIWVTNRAAGTVTRVDAKANKADAPIAVGAAPCHPPVSAFKSVWVARCAPAGLARIDPGAPTTPPVAISADARAVGPLTTGTGSIWMITDVAGILSRIDPDTNAAVAEVTIPAGASAIAFGVGSVWVTSSTRDVVTRVNGDTNVVAELIKVGRGPSSVAVGEGSVWVLNGGDGTVSRIDPKTNKVTDTIKTGVSGANATVAVGEGSVWVSAAGMPLTRIDPATNRMVQQFSGPGGGALAFGSGSLWIAATPTSIWRVDPKRVEATRK